MSHSHKIHRSHRMRGMHSRCRLAVFHFFAVDPWARVEYTPSLHLLLTIMRRSKETTACVCAYGYSPICRDRYLGFFSFGNGDCGRTAYQHACRRVSGLREDAPWFVCRWLLASAVSCRALSSFARQRLVSFDFAAIVREMIPRWLSIAPSSRYLLTGYCRRVNWTRSW